MSPVGSETPMLKRFCALFLVAWMAFQPCEVIATGEPSRPAQAGPRLVQSAERPREFFVGEWSTRNVEFGRDVEIYWTLFADGRLAYRFVIDGVASEGSRGTWSVQGNRLEERWIRAGGETETGAGAIEWIDDNTLHLTIIDNGNPDYERKVRVYRRRGPPQVSMFQP